MHLRAVYLANTHKGLQPAASVQHVDLRQTVSLRQLRNFYKCYSKSYKMHYRYCRLTAKKQLFCNLIDESNSLASGRELGASLFV